MNEPERQIMSILGEAVEYRSPEERAAFLEKACAGDAGRRARVEALLRAYEAAGNFLQGDSPPRKPVATVDESSREQSGTMIGPYKLLEEIGEGGMGTVWMAQQTEPVTRLVAVKLIKAGMDSKQVLARFDVERQALALMDHPNIAKVHDAGTTSDGRPYFVMELVKGVPITTYCDRHRLTPRQRLDLFLPVCQAIQHAHQKGVIHRDIKPSNVLIALYDDKPVPKVIDFGVAKATGQQLGEQSLHTGFGAVVGTLEYMSPEQAGFNQLDVDTRSDIYSLGVLLYELLAGSPPFSRKELEKAGMMEMLRVIREQEPSKPSTKLSTADGLPTLAVNRGTEPKRLTALVRGELDWIVMKALEKDRSRRYETANGFAMDVQRYLADEPVQAYPPSAGYRLRKFARRNKAAFVTAFVVMGALLAGTAVATWQALRATRAEREALAAAAAEQTAKQDAEAREAETRAVLDFVVGKVFAAGRPKDQGGGLGHDVPLRQAVEAALPFVNKSFTDKPLIEARLRWTVGTSFLYLGEAKIAAEQYEAAGALYTKHLGPDHPDTLKSMHTLALSYAALARHADALKLTEETLALCKTKLGPDHPDTLLSMTNLANSYSDLGRHADALKLREETLALQKAKLGPDHPDTLISMNNLANSYAALARHADALKLTEETLALCKTKLGPDHPQTLSSMHNLANSYYDRGRYAEALKLHEEALPLRKAKLGLDHPDTLQSMNDLAIHYAALGRHAEALKLHAETLPLRKAKLGLDHPDTLQSMNDLALSYAALGRHAEALKLHEETLPLRKAKLGPDHPDTLGSMSNLANSYAALGRHTDALKLREETLALMKAKIPDHHFTFNCMVNLANSYADLSRPVEALKLREETLPLMKAKLGPNHPDTLVSMANLANSYSDLGRPVEALKLREETLALRKVKLGPDHPSTLESMNALANSYSDLGRHAEALKLREETLALRNAKLGPDHPHTLGSMHNLANSYSDLGRYAEALKLREETLALRKAKLGPDHPHTLVSMNSLAWSLAACPDPKLRDPARALELAKKAVKGGPRNPLFPSTLGVAHSRLGQWKEAIAALDQSMKLRNGGNAVEWFWLAMAHGQLGDKEKARALYNKAVQWMDKNQPKHGELRGFRAEAAELLKIADGTQPK